MLDPKEYRESRKETWRALCRCYDILLAVPNYNEQPEIEALAIRVSDLRFKLWKEITEVEEVI